ncbi:hypothetical protein EVJ58_g568 [Rhodofomes roseus]|uniref:Uncharacterized protein n=1 Tax=Rhodofomes roseus TaxID=34475 RepID=A0A4Y9Z3L8_9APHY|nr:hypothetical protein EVJ58_g568 [Rhodofomes roseus]
MASTSTRPVRRGGTHTTRTQRALVRGYWEDEYTVHQITEYMNLTRRDTWHAIKNQSGDNLDEDEDYRNGTIGDVINVENLLLDIEPQGKASIKGEEEDIEEVDEKVDMDIQSDNDELEYVDVEMLGIQPIGPGSRGAAQRNQQHPQVSPVVTSPSQAVDPVRVPTSLKTNTNVKDDPQFPVPTAPLSTPDFARRAAGSNTPRDAAQSSHNNTGTSSSSTASSENGTAHLDRQISPIQAFLGQLKRPLSHLTGAFTDFGVSTEEDLDVLSVLKDQWVLLQTFLCDTKKATHFEWMILKAGLELRAAQTSCK